ncbi:MAG: response regulator [Anaerolineae bacterium]
MAGKRILVIDADVASRNFIARTLQKEQYEVDVAPSGKEGLIEAWRNRPDLIIIDPVLPDLKGETVAFKLRQDPRTERVPLIALSSDPALNRLKECLDAGFNEYIVKSGQGIITLKDAVRRLLGLQALPPTEGGLLVAFLSAKGGTGTSSLCANIATMIAAYQPEATVAVADLVLPIGSIAQIVGYQGHENIVTLADLPPHLLTPEFLREHLSEIGEWRFRLLAGSPDPESANRLQVARISEIIAALRAAFDFVILDVGRSLSRIILPLLQHSDLIALIVGSDLSTTMLTKTTLDYLHNKGIHKDAIYPILNRAVGLEGLTKAEAEQWLGIPIKLTIPYLGSNFVLTNNQHIPFSVKFPRDTATLSLKDAAQQMVDLANQLRKQKMEVKT